MIREIIRASLHYLPSSPTARKDVCDPDSTRDAPADVTEGIFTRILKNPSDPEEPQSILYSTSCPGLTP